MNLTNNLAASVSPIRPRDWRFVDTGATRDLRLDFMRGLVFILLFVVHFDYFSLFTYFAWERLGVVSSAETFIALAGIVTGMVFGRKMLIQGLGACIPGLLKRGWDLYWINLLVILSIGVLRYLPWLDLTLLTTFHDPYTNITYPLYPPVESGVFKLIRDALYLRCGPHQFQIMGLYAALFLFTPVILFMIEKSRTLLLSGVSVALYLINFLTPETPVGTAGIRVTGAQFEYGFPLIAWQLLFVHGVIAGYYKFFIVEWFSARKNRFWLCLCVAMAIGFMLFSLNHTIDLFPDWARLHVIPADTFNAIYNGYFKKYNLGPGRLLNQVVMLVTVYALLTRCWHPINQAFGWLFIPLGTASLYVFTIHILMLQLIATTPLPGLHNFWVNTAIHLGALLLAWWFVKKQFLFRWLPH
jgi:hypothetical protein